MRLFIALLVTLITSASLAHAEITISNMRVKTGHHAAAAHLTLNNSGTQDDALVRVESNAYGTIELHTMTMNDNIMKMRRVDEFIIAAGGSHILKPHGDHLMLFEPRDITAPVEFTFFFKIHPPITVAPQTPNP